ncbi:hypothetical protein MMPV_005563 [Pyropia vietnamensis]
MPVRHVPSIAAAGDAAYAVTTGEVPLVTSARCRFFAAGACTAGDDCRFIHELPEHLRPPPAPAPGPDVPIVRPRAADFTVAGREGRAAAGAAATPGVEAPGDGYVDFSAAYAGAFASAVAVPSPPQRQRPLAPHQSSSLPAGGLGSHAADLGAVGAGRAAEEGDDVGGVPLRRKVGGGKHGAVGDGKLGGSAVGGSRWTPTGGFGGGPADGSWDATPAAHGSWDASSTAHASWDATTGANGGWEGAAAARDGWDAAATARRVPPNPWAATAPFAPLLPVGMTGLPVDAPVTAGPPYGPLGGEGGGGGGSGAAGIAAADALTARFGAATLGGGTTRGLYTTRAPSDRSAHHRLTAATSAFTPGGGGWGGSAAPPVSAAAVPPPLCRFHLTGNCRYGDGCRYTHGVPCPVCGENAVHPTDGAEAERHLVACGWLVAGDVTGPPAPASSTGGGSPRGLTPGGGGVGGPPPLSPADEAAQVALRCALCHESVRGRGRRFGLLTECDHVFCLECVRSVRSTVAAVGGREAVRGCSVCGVESFLVVPSDTYPRSAAEKASATARYKAKLKRVPCMHFRFGEGVCPFGVTSCLYAHVDREGVPVAADGREVVVDGEGVATGRRGLSMGDFLIVKPVKGKKRRGAGVGGGAG